MPKKILILAILLFIFNIIDAGCTTFLIVTATGYEANPLMAWLIEQGLEWFWLFKITTAGLASYVLAKFHNHQGARLGLYVVVAFYSILMLYYLIGFCFLFL